MTEQTLADLEKYKRALGVVGAWCCWGETDCMEPPLFEVWCEDPTDPYASTHACAKHLADLICDGHAHRIVNMDSSPQREESGDEL